MRFEIGKLYKAWDEATPAIKVIKRTAKTITVQGTDFQEDDIWTMRVKEHDNGDEWVHDSRYPDSWGDVLTYEANEERFSWETELR